MVNRIFCFGAIVRFLGFLLLLSQVSLAESVMLKRSFVSSDTFELTVGQKKFKYSCDVEVSGSQKMAILQIQRKAAMKGYAYFEAKLNDTIRLPGGFSAVVTEIKDANYRSEAVSLNILAEDSADVIVYVNNSRSWTELDLRGVVFGFYAFNDTRFVTVRGEKKTFASTDSTLTLDNGAVIRMFPSLSPKIFNAAVLSMPRDSEIEIDYNVSFNVDISEDSLLHYSYFVNTVPYGTPWMFPLNVAVKLTTNDTTYNDTDVIFSEGVSHNSQRYAKRPPKILIGEITIDYTNSIKEMGIIENVMSDTAYGKDGIRRRVSAAFALNSEKGKLRFNIKGARVRWSTGQHMSVAFDEEQRLTAPLLGKKD